MSDADVCYYLLSGVTMRVGSLNEASPVVASTALAVLATGLRRALLGRSMALVVAKIVLVRKAR